jgi:carboxypeptidase C (cathepsin A)
VLNFQTIDFAVGNDLPYILFLPTYTATAFWHDKLSELETTKEDSFEKILDEVREFAISDYTTALMQGSAISDRKKQAIVKKLATYTGLTAEYIEKTDIRIKINRFCKELLREEGRTVGRSDSRFTGIDRDSAGENSEYDPSLAVIQGAYTATLNDYVRGDLEFESDLPYEIFSGRVHPWDFGSHQNEYVNVADTLRKAMTTNPALKVYVASGYYDLATPFLATEYTFTHLGLDKSLQDNITMAYYGAGHMMYIDMDELKKMKADMDAYLDDTLSDL